MLTRRALTSFPPLSSRSKSISCLLNNLNSSDQSSSRYSRKSQLTLNSSSFTSYSCKPSRRGYSTNVPQKDSDSDSDSIFSPTNSPWDHVFADIKEVPPLLPSSARRRNKPSSPVTTPSTATTTPTPPTQLKNSRRQTMTAREISTFDEMFNMIFNAVSQHKHEGSRTNKTDSDIAIGLGPKLGSSSKAIREMTDLFGTLRKHYKKVKWTSASDEELDRKKEEMELCDTDQQLLEWAMREVFGESQKYEEAARKAIDQVAKGERVQSMPMLQPPAYPHLISVLMRTFRCKYHDPHLTLSIFDYARHLSIPSYVFGCTAPAYNELIETRWSCFRDLRGILEALEEMNVNGVEPDNRTRQIVEVIRREAGQKTSWEEEDHLGNGGQVWSMLSQIESLAAKPSPPPPKKLRLSRNPAQKPWGAWKNKGRKEPNDQWQFGNWDPIQSEYSFNR